jgi:flavin-dependent dehydrogenase
VIAADGVGSTIRKQLRPGDFVAGKAPGYGINYYIKPRDPSKIKIPKTTLLQVWDTTFNNDMFAWVYLKDEPGCTDEKTSSGECTNAWVVGTSYTGGNIDDVGKKLLDHVSKTYGLDGTILRTEKIQVNLDLADQSRRFAFGDGKNGNILYVGDAAGLIDAVRGLGMDSAALSARKAVSSIIETDRCITDNGKEQCPRASAIYEERMKTTRDQLAEGSKGTRGVFNSNEDLSIYLDTQMSPVAGIKKMACTFFNGFKNPGDMDLC